jgi:hypothetical protein
MILQTSNRSRSCKSFFIVAALLAIAFSTPSANAAKDIGAGLFLGSPTGITGQVFLKDDKAIRAMLGVNGGKADLNADYVFWFPDAVGNDKMSFSFFVGAGLRLRFSDPNRFGVRVPVGLSTFFDNDESFEGFVEIAPIVDLAPKVDLDINGGIGVRYYFM